MANLLRILVRLLREKASTTIKIRLFSILKVLFVVSFAISFLILWILYPSSYEETWKGRAYYLFFLWLSSLELSMNWKEIPLKIQEVRSSRLITLFIVSLLPTVYVLAAYFSGLNTLIMEISPKHYGLDWWSRTMPLTVEYLVFTILSLVMAVLAYGIKGLRYFLLPITLIGILGAIYLIDNLYPFGEFTPFQILVPSTAILASNLLALMGYRVDLEGQSYKTPVLRVWSDRGEAAFGIAWPCSGIDSLIIYSVITILFLKDEDFSWRRKAAYFLIGAIITYLINALRIVRIFMLAVEYGATSLEVQRFHNYYGPLYSMLWIIAYQLVIIGVQFLSKRRCRSV
ncbi:MAG: archaeosortase/exosortase family protein [Candidatus Bathyarchaeia archaeon]